MFLNSKLALIKIKGARKSTCFKKLNRDRSGAITPENYKCSFHSITSCNILNPQTLFPNSAILKCSASNHTSRFSDAFFTGFHTGFTQRAIMLFCPISRAAMIVPLTQHQGHGLRVCQKISTSTGRISCQNLAAARH